jgi:hypothetical protein
MRYALGLLARLRGWMPELGGCVDPHLEKAFRDVGAAVDTYHCQLLTAAAIDQLVAVFFARLLAVDEFPEEMYATVYMFVRLAFAPGVTWRAKNFRHVAFFLFEGGQCPPANLCKLYEIFEINVDSF